MNYLHMCNNLLIYKNKNNIYETQYIKRPNFFAIEILQYPTCDEARLYINRVGENDNNKTLLVTFSSSDFMIIKEKVV